MSVQPLSTKHDLHCHSSLSLCCNDSSCTAAAVYQLARNMGYDTICLTDHLWDAEVPGPNGFYRQQDINHVYEGKPFANVPGIRCLFGCETEYAGGGRLGLTKEHFDLFDFVVIPPNHMHMKGLVRPNDVTTVEQMAELFTCRLEELSQLDIPMEKVGIAHLTCSLLYSEGNILDVIRMMDGERLKKAFETFARRGAGIELNAQSFQKMDEDPDACLRLYRIAKEAGCKFYCSSDAHSIPEYELVAQTLPAIIDALGLTEDDRYVIPG